MTWVVRQHVSCPLLFKLPLILSNQGGFFPSSFQSFSTLTACRNVFNPPLPVLWFPCHFLHASWYYLSFLLLWHIMFTLIGWSWHRLIPLICSSSLLTPHPCSFGPLPCCTMYVCMFLSIYPVSSSLYFASLKERYDMVFPLVYLMHFTQRYFFQMYPFSYKCLRFVFLYIRVVFHCI